MCVHVRACACVCEAEQVERMRSRHTEVADWREYESHSGSRFFPGHSLPLSVMIHICISERQKGLKAKSMLLATGTILTELALRP